MHEIYINLDALSEPGEGDELVTPQEGDTVVFQVEGKLERVDGEGGYVQLTKANGQDLAAPPEPEMPVDDEAALMRDMEQMDRAY